MTLEEGVELAGSRRSAPAARRVLARPSNDRRAGAGAGLGGGARTPGAIVGLGSNLLVADVASRPRAQLARRPGRGRGAASLCGPGGGAPNAVALHRARAAGLGGFEFACAIPGTAGGGVWMNAGRLRQRLVGIVERASGRHRAGSGWLSPAELGLSYRHSELRHGQVVAQAEFRLARGRGGDQGDGRRAPGAAEGGAADEQAHVRERLQEPRARADRGADARGLRPEGPSDRRRADLAEARELHRERRRRDDGGRARADGRGAPARARAVRRRARSTRSSSSARSSSRSPEDTSP